MKRGFTLIELFIVVLIIGILAAVAAARVMKMAEEALIERTMADASAIHQAALLHLAEKGDLPAQTVEGDGPGAFNGYISGDVFNKPPPIGGIGYGWMRSYSNLDGLVYVDFGSNRLPGDIMATIDKRFDDGVASRCLIRTVANRWAVFGLYEK